MNLRGFFFRDCWPRVGPGVSPTKPFGPLSGANGRYVPKVPPARDDDSLDGLPGSKGLLFKFPKGVADRAGVSVSGGMAIGSVRKIMLNDFHRTDETLVCQFCGEESLADEWGDDRQTCPHCGRAYDYRVASDSTDGR